MTGRKNEGRGPPGVAAATTGTNRTMRAALRSQVETSNQSNYCEVRRIEAEPPVYLPRAPTKKYLGAWLGAEQ